MLTQTLQQRRFPGLFDRSYRFFRYDDAAEGDLIEEQPECGLRDVGEVLNVSRTR